MPARRKLTDEQIAFARQIVARRRELARQLRALPTNAELAAQLGCAERYLVELVSGRARASTLVASELSASAHFERE